jgi:hypothetical protein
MALDLFQGGKVFKTTAYRAMQGKDWTDADNLWKLRMTGDLKDAGMTLPDIKFADWAGGVSKLGDYTGTPTLKFLSTPQNTRVQDPDSKRWSNVAYTASDNPALAALGATPERPWIQPAGMRTAGFPDAYGGKWVLPGIYGHTMETGNDPSVPTTNLLGYGLPQFLAEQYYGTGADITPKGGWGSVFPNFDDSQQIEE